jgi:hypothetical protein
MLQPARSRPTEVASDRCRGIVPPADRRAAQCHVDSLGREAADRRAHHRVPPVFESVALLMDVSAQRVLLRHGDVLIAHQRRGVHGRTALGRQNSVARSAQRLWAQAKVRFDASALVHGVLPLRSAAWPVRAADVAVVCTGVIGLAAA